MTVGSFLRSFWHSQLFVTPSEVKHDFSGQTIIVTGSNVGLGLEAARQLAALGCSRLIIAVRTVSKGEDAKLSIMESTKRTDDFIEVWPLDMSKTESVKAFATRAQSLDRLDVVIENAGVAMTHWAAFEGMEQNIKINVVSTCLLALLLLPKLRETGNRFQTTPRLVIVSSDAHKVTKYPEWREEDIFSKLADKDQFEIGGARYPVSKLMEILFVRELVKHTTDNPIITTINPGLCHSELANRTPSKIGYWSGQVFKFLLARKTEVGARTLLAGACVGKDGHGQYMEDGKIIQPDIWAAESDKAEMQIRTYDQILAYLEKLEPGIRKNI